MTCKTATAPSGRPCHRATLFEAGPLARLVQLTLVGTGHVFRIGEIVERIITERQPHVVCVELDPTRLMGLKERARLQAYEEAGDPRAEEMRRQHDEATKRMPRLYRLLAKLQERIADQEGVEAGNEMLAAVTAAERIDAPVATIDVDAQDLIRRAWKAMSWKERLRFIWAMMRGQKGSQVESELEEYQQDPVAYLARVGDEFPALKRVLIDERDEHMASHLLRLHEAGLNGVQQQMRRQKQAQGQNEPVPDGPDADPVTQAGEQEQRAADPEEADEANGDTEAEEGELVVVAVVGDGHVPGMLRLLEEKLPADTIEKIRVGDLRAGRIPEARNIQAEHPQSGDHESVSLQYDVPASDHPDRDPPV